MMSRIYVPPKAVVESYAAFGSACSTWDRTSTVDPNAPPAQPLPQPYGHLMAACEVVEDYPKVIDILQGELVVAGALGIAFGLVGAVVVHRIVVWIARLLRARATRNGAAA